MRTVAYSGSEGARSGWQLVVTGLCVVALGVTSGFASAVEPSPSPSASPSSVVSPSPVPSPVVTPEPSPEVSPAPEPSPSPSEPEDSSGVVTLDGNELLERAPVVPVQSRPVDPVPPASNAATNGVFGPAEVVLPGSSTEWVMVDSSEGLEGTIDARRRAPELGSILVGVGEAPLESLVHDRYAVDGGLVTALSGRPDLLMQGLPRMVAGEEVRVEVLAGSDSVPGTAFTARVSQVGVGAGEWVEVAFDVSGFEHAFGGDYGDRLTFVLLPECALTTPEEPGCVTGVPVTTRRDSGGVMRAFVPVEAYSLADVDGRFSMPMVSSQGVRMEIPSGGTIIAAISGADSQAGTFKATDLAPRGTWGVSEPTGSFTYSIPIAIPPVRFGPVPSVVFSYSSQTVDGKSIATNSQAGVIGEGWSMPLSYIERLFKTCADDGYTTSGRGGSKCWASPYSDRVDEAAYVLSLQGKTEELVWVGTDAEDKEAHYVAASDPSLKVTRYWQDSGSRNGDDNGEYFEVLTSEGTVYYFGYEPDRTSKPTNSVAYVPVYGNNSGEPGSFTQGYRFMVDLVVDVDGQAMSYYYTVETNHYLAETGVSKPYIRDIQLARIDYGQRYTPSTGELTDPEAKVEFDLVSRCVEASQFTDLRTTTVTCPDVVASPASYPDVPADLICTGTCTSAQSSPVFFTMVRLNQVNTSVKVGETWQPVDTNQLITAFPTTDDGSARSLWLDSVYTYAHGDPSTTEDDRQTYLTKFSGVRLNNRVDWDLFPSYTIQGPQRPLDRMRISSVFTDMGGRIDVTYAVPDAGLSVPGVPPGTLCPQNGVKGTGYSTWSAAHPVAEINSAANDQLCYAVKRGTLTELFHNYVVTQIDLVDAVAGTPTMTHLYEYGGTPGYGFADSVLDIPGTGDGTYSSYRGFETVSSMMAPDSMRDTSGSIVRLDPARIRSGDFDGDGLTDLFTVHGDGSWWYAPSGTGDWVFLKSDAGLPVEDLRFGNFGGDSKTDVFTRDSGGQWKYAESGLGDWVPLIVDSTVPLSDLRFGDFSNPADGITDVFTRDGSGTWKYRSGGAGSWVTLLTGTSTALADLRFGDFNDDDRTDVFLRNSDGQWRYFSGGVGSQILVFKEPSVPLARLQFADVDGDGKTDVLTRNPDGSWQYSSGGAQSWAPLGGASKGAVSSNLDLVDVTGDGRADVFTVSNGDWQVSSAGRLPLETFATGTGLSLSDLQFGDFDGDGTQDAFTCDSNFQWKYSPSGTGQWVPLWLDTSATPCGSLRLGDFDGDGVTDVYANLGAGGIVSYGGTAAWTTGFNLTGLTSVDSRYGDFNGDGKTDIFYRNPSGTWHYLSGGTGSWLNLAGDSSTPLSNFRFGDFDGDGKTDVFAYRSTTDWRYSSGGAVTYTILPSDPSVALADLRFGDVDGDGKTDLFTQDVSGNWKYSSGATGPWASLDGTPRGAASSATGFGYFDSGDTADMFVVDSLGRVQVSPSGVAGWVTLTHPEAVVTTNQYYRGLDSGAFTSIADDAIVVDDPRLSGRVAASRTTILSDTGAEVIATSATTYDLVPIGTVPRWKYGPTSVTHNPHMVLTPSATSTSVDGSWSVTSESSTVFDRVDTTFGTVLFLPVQSESVVTEMDGQTQGQVEKQRATTTYVQGDEVYLVLPSGGESYTWVDGEPEGAWVLTGKSEIWYDTVPPSSGAWTTGNTPVKGLPTGERSYFAGGAADYTEARASYDDDGWIVAAWMPNDVASYPNNPSVSWSYGTDGEFWTTTVTRPLGMVSTSWAEPTRGNVVKSKGPNARDWTHYEYDALGLLVAGWAPVQWGFEEAPEMAPVQPEPPAEPIDPVIPTVLYVYDVYAEGPMLRTTPVTVVSAQFVADTGTEYVGFESTSTTRRSYTFLDGWGRSLEQHTPAADGKRYLEGVENEAGTPGRTVVRTEFDSLGRVAWTSAPFLNVDAPAQIGSGLVNPSLGDLESATWSDYDVRGRVVGQSLMSLGEVVEVDEMPATTTTAYSGPETTVTSPTGSVSTLTVDILGRLVRQQQCESASLCGELDGIITTYEYQTLASAVEDYEGVGFSRVTVTDAENNPTVFVSNLAGQRTFMSDPNSGESTYLYDDDGRTTWVESQTGVIRMGYDVLGRMTVRRMFETVAAATALTDWTTTPSTHWQSETVWDYIDSVVDGPVGALETTSSTSRIDLGVSVESFATTSMVDEFDVFGRPLSTTVTLPESPTGTTLLGDLSGYSYTTSTSYDEVTGVVTGSTLPPIGGLPNEVVSTGYRRNGMAQTLTLHAPILAPAVEPEWSTTVVTGTSVDGTGLFQSRDYGNGVVRSIGWDTTLRSPEVIAASFDYTVGEDPQTAFLQLDELTRDVAGRVTMIDDLVSSSAQCFVYDGHNRLKSAWTTGDPCGNRPEAPSTSWLVGDPTSAAYAASYATEWDYSDSGRIESIVNLTASGDPLVGVAVTNQFPYTGTQPHAVSATSDGTTSTSYTYDGAGRMFTRTVDGVTTTFTWDVSSNLVTTVEEGGASFLYLYDGSGQRVLKARLDDPLTTEVSEGTATAYLGSTEITDPDTSDNADLVSNPDALDGPGFVTGTRFYTFGGATVAVRKGNAVFDDSLSLLVGDFQGSASILVPVHVDATTKAMLPATLADAQNATRNAYLPYGATRGGDLLDIDHGWLNQVTDETDTGLIYLNARYYDPVLSRFLSPDPLMNPTDPKTLDPYRYADNNPVLFQDASGLNPGCSSTDAKCWADYASSSAYKTVKPPCEGLACAITTPPRTDGKPKRNWGLEKVQMQNSDVIALGLARIAHANRSTLPRAHVDQTSPEFRAGRMHYRMMFGDQDFADNYFLGMFQLAGLRSQRDEIWQEFDIVSGTNDWEEQWLQLALLSGGEIYSGGNFCGDFMVCVVNSGISPITGATTFTHGRVVITSRPEMTDEVQAHEYGHVGQELAMGVPRFMKDYAISTGIHGYTDSPYEVDARARSDAWIEGNGDMSVFQNPYAGGRLPGG